MKARIIVAIIVIPCVGVFGVFNLCLWKIVDKLTLPVNRWLKRGYYRNDSNDNY